MSILLTMKTKRDPNESVKLGMLNEAVDAILEGLANKIVFRLTI